VPGAWLVGGLVGLALPTIHTATLVTTLSFLALGGLVAAEARLRPEWVTALAVVVGLLHGQLNGAAMAQAKLGTLGLAGIVSTLFVAVAVAAAIVVAIRAPWGRIAVRVAGNLDRRDRAPAARLVAQRLPEEPSPSPHKSTAVPVGRAACARTYWTRDGAPS